MADSKPAAYTAPALVASRSHPVRANAKLISLLALGHFVVDLKQGSLPALLPFLKAAHQLSYVVVATIVLGVTVLGWIADRDGLPTALWITAFTPLVAFVASRFLPAPRARADT